MGGNVIPILLYEGRVGGRINDMTVTGAGTELKPCQL